MSLGTSMYAATSQYARGDETTRPSTARSRATRYSTSMRAGTSRVPGRSSQKSTTCSTRNTTRWGAWRELLHRAGSHLRCGQHRQQAVPVSGSAAGGLGRHPLLVRRRRAIAARNAKRFTLPKPAAAYGLQAPGARLASERTGNESEPARMQALFLEGTK